MWNSKHSTLSNHQIHRSLASSVYRHPLSRLRYRLIVLVVLLALAAPVAAYVSGNDSQAPETQRSKSTESVVPQGELPAGPLTQNAEEQEHMSDLSSQSEGSEQNYSSTSVTVNGQDIPVPENGSLDRTIITPGSDAKVHVQITNENRSTGSTSMRSTDVQIESYGSGDISVSH